MLDEIELQIVRGDLEAELLEPQTARILKATAAKTATGGTTYTWPSSASVVPIAARISPMGAAETALWGEKLTQEIGYVVTLPAGTDVDAPDRIEMGPRTLEVIGAAPGRSWELTLRVATKEIR